MRALVIAVLVVAGCYSSPLEAPRRMCSGEGSVRVDAPLVNKVDFLFVVDDSPGMAPKQAALRAAVPKLIAQLDALADKGTPGWYHFGVISADLGAGGDNVDAQHCRRGGDNGALQVPAACGFALSGGVRFIDDDLVAGGNNIVGGADVAAALSCMTSLGEAGCGFPQPLEASYRALHDPNPDNQGFLRSDALLVIVYVTDRDDCSVPFDSDLFETATDRYGVLDRFRCTQFGIMCNGQPLPPMSVSGLTGCEPMPMAAGGKLVDVQKYINFFTRPAAQGGVKVSPNDVTLVGIAGPADPVGVSIVSPCPDDASATSCGVLDHSCVSPNDMTMFADPAVRLDVVVESAKHTNLTSVCDEDYGPAIDALGQLTTSQIASGCLQSTVAMHADGTPDCVATDITNQIDGTTTTMTLPSCAENGHVTPCWELIDVLQQYRDQGCTTPGGLPPATCKLPPGCQPVTTPDGTEQLYTVHIDRGGAEAPRYTATQLACTIACE